MNNKWLLELSKIATSLCGVMVVVFCIFCTIACPSEQLIAAVSFEAAIMLSFIYWRHIRRAKPPEPMREQINLWLTSVYPRTASLYRLWQSFTAVAAISAFVFLFVEFCGFTLCASGANAAGEAILTVSPLGHVVGKPGKSLEYLAGAFKQAGNYKDARPLYDSILRIRESTSGANSDAAAEVWTDIGSLCAEVNLWKESEQALHHSFSLAHEARKDNRLGRSLTLLGNALIKLNRPEEAEAMYRQAIEMRSAKFGADSLKVAETLREYSLLLRQQNRPTETKEVEAKVWRILQAHKQSAPTTDFSLVSVFTVVVALASWFLFGPVAPVELVARYKLKQIARQCELTTAEQDIARHLKLNLSVRQPAIHVVEAGASFGVSETRSNTMPS